MTLSGEESGEDSETTAHCLVNYFCSENFITVLTPSVYDYQYLPEVPVSRKTHVAFRVHAAADAHIALSHVYGDTDRRTYEIVLGGWNNTKSAIRYGGKGHVEVEQVGQWKKCRTYTPLLSLHLHYK